MGAVIIYRPRACAQYLYIVHSTYVTKWYSFTVGPLLLLLLLPYRAR